MNFCFQKDTKKKLKRKKTLEELYGTIPKELESTPVTHEEGEVYEIGK